MSFWLLQMFFTAGLILGFNGAVRLSARKRTGAWKEGGAAALAGAIIAGVSLSYLMSSPGRAYDKLWGLMGVLILVGLVLVFNGLVELSVRNRTGPWKEGGASLLAGVILVGVSVLAGVLFPGTIEYLLIAGLVLAFNGVVRLGVGKKTGPWEEGSASLLAGAVLVGGTILFWKVLDMWGFELLWWGHILFFCSVAGLVVLFSGLVQVCVRKKTGKWKEGGASVLAGVIVAGALPILWLAGFLFRLLQ
jgi:uncharacterized membrane protein